MCPRILLPSAALSWALSIFALGGCGFTPPPVLHYQTADSADLWQQGLRQHPGRTPGFSFTTAYLEFSRDAVPGLGGSRSIVFRVAVRNEGPGSALLDPVDFALIPPGSGPALPPIDPERVLAAAERGKAAEQAMYADADLAEGIADLPLVILNLASDLSGATTAQQDLERRELEAYRREQRRDRAARHTKAMAEWKGVTDAWSANALRKTTLLPGTEAQGRVAFAVPADSLPADTLLLRWKRPDGAWAELGRYGRPPLPKPEPKPAAADPRRPTFMGSASR